MKKALITSLVILLVCVSVSSVQAYTNERYNFSIDPPSGWTVDDTVTFAVVVFYGPTEGGFRVNVNIQAESTTLTLEQYVPAAKEPLPILLDNYELVSEGTRVINEVDAYELVYTFTQGGIDIKLKQVILVKAKKAYIITYGALPTTYQKYLSAFESSVETFKILESPWYIQYWYVWVIIAVAVIAPLAFYLIWRRRAKAVPPPTAPAPPTPPPATAPPTVSAVANSRLPTKS